ncbi:putative ribonuclease H protein At1g65750 family [Senna tora]|uniref:Putative ribonuclease H protein At1g65750 family n=1 Tax=Senna tora TaxID=362788 RepID=A0A834W8X8_9FABA|nr:putative ribonuclease H protein At1g65750 family [Senna tora]
MEDPVKEKAGEAEAGVGEGEITPLMGELDKGVFGDDSVEVEKGAEIGVTMGFREIQNVVARVDKENIDPLPTKKSVRKYKKEARIATVDSKGYMGVDVLSKRKRGEMRVCDLMDESGGWREEVLSFLFQPDICHRIKSIRALDVRRADKWIWLGEAKGGFTVKQCYLNAMRDKWQGIDPLPNIQALKTQVVELATACTFCGLEEEEMYHVLVDYPIINVIWSGSRFSYESRKWHNNIVEWLAVEGSTWSQDQLGMCVVALYLIWEARNAKRFSYSSLDSKAWKEWEASFGLNVRWEKPGRGWVKLNTDAGCLPEGGGVIGGLIRDEEGVCLAAFTEKRAETSNPTVLEAEAVRRGMEVALQLGDDSSQVKFEPRKRSLVLICLFHGNDGNLRVILTLRATAMSNFKDEVVLPGGKREEGDANDVETALREAKEEIGLEPSLVSRRGEMESQEKLQDPSPPLSTEEADNLHRSCKKIKTNEEEGPMEDLTMDECPPIVSAVAPNEGVLEQIQEMVEADESMPDLMISDAPDADRVKKALWQKDKPDSQSYMEKLLEEKKEKDKNVNSEPGNMDNPINLDVSRKVQVGDEAFGPWMLVPKVDRRKSSNVPSSLENEDHPVSDVVPIPSEKDNLENNKQGNVSNSQSHPVAETKTRPKKSKPQKAYPIFAMSKKQGPNVQLAAIPKRSQRLPSDRHSDHTVVSSQAQGTKNLSVLNNSVKSPVKLKEAFPSSSIQVLPKLKSDHNPLLLRTKLERSNSPKDKPFRLQLAWATNKDFKKLVDSSWAHNKPWLQGLQDFTSLVKKWNQTEFGNVFLRKKNLIRRLEGIERKLATSYHGGLVKLKSKIWKEYESTLLQEELIWYQKSRNNWLLFGDRNTSFFHNSTIVRRSKNRIEALKDDEDNWTWDDSSLQQIVQGYYKELYSKGDSVSTKWGMDGSFPIMDDSFSQSLGREEWVFFNLKTNCGMSPSFNWDSTFGTTCWNIWKQRNDWVLNNNHSHGLALLHTINAQLEDLKMVHSLLKSGPNQHRVKLQSNYIKWNPPEEVGLNLMLMVRLFRISLPVGELLGTVKGAGFWDLVRSLATVAVFMLRFGVSGLRYAWPRREICDLSSLNQIALLLWILSVMDVAIPTLFMVLLPRSETSFSLTFQLLSPSFTEKEIELLIVLLD